jgi:hypothetical protein
VDPSERIVRHGPLTEQALSDALATERRSGRHPVQLAVGAASLERAALAILDGHSDALGALRAGVANVVLDLDLRADEWELREAEHAV